MSKKKIKTDWTWAVKLKNSTCTVLIAPKSSVELLSRLNLTAKKVIVTLDRGKQSSSA